MADLSQKKIGKRVTCTACRRQKKPRGRSAPIYASMCDDECTGYYAEPFVGDLWPGESEADFGYPSSDHGTYTAPERFEDVKGEKDNGT